MVSAPAPDYVPRWGASEERARMRTLSLSEPCEVCGAGIGVICHNTITGLDLSWRLPAHNSRLIAVGYGNH